VDTIYFPTFSKITYTIMHSQFIVNHSFWYNSKTCICYKIIIII